MVNLVSCLTSLLFLDIPLLYYYHNNLNSSIIYSFSSGDIYLCFDNSVSLSTVSEVFWGEFFETFVTSLAHFLTVKSPVASTVF